MHVATKKHPKKASRAVHRKKAAHVIVKKAAKKPAKRAVAQPSKKSAKLHSKGAGKKGSKKLWLAKPSEKDPGLEEDWKSDLDDEMDFAENEFSTEE